MNEEVEEVEEAVDIFSSAEVAAKFATIDRDSWSWFGRTTHFTKFDVPKLAELGYQEALDLVLTRVYVCEYKQQWMTRDTLGDRREAISTWELVDYDQVDYVFKLTKPYWSNLFTMMKNPSICKYVFKHWKKFAKTFDPHKLLTLCAQQKYADGIKKCLKWYKHIYTANDLLEVIAIIDDEYDADLKKLKTKLYKRAFKLRSCENK